MEEIKKPEKEMHLGKPVVSMSDIKPLTKDTENYKKLLKISEILEQMRQKKAFNFDDKVIIYTHQKMLEDNPSEEDIKTITKVFINSINVGDIKLNLPFKDAYELKKIIQN